MTKVTEKKQKVSKKTKRSWRKHIDTKDVDTYLDNVRLEERLGAPFSKRLDSELFVIDKTSAETVPLNNKQQHRLTLKNKEPKCFAILNAYTAVPDPIAKRNRVRTPEERKNPIRRRMEAKHRLNGVKKLKERVANKNRVLAQAKRNSKFKRGEIHSDVWEEVVAPSELKSQWLTNDTIRHTLANTGQRRKRVRGALYKKPSILPAVELPHPGISYNPSYVDHQDLLNKVAQNEIKLIKEEAHLNRVTTSMFKKVSAAERDKKWMKELSEGLPMNPEDKKVLHSDTEENDGTVKSINPPVKNKKKTLVTRRKQKEQKELALKHDQMKVEKKKVADIYKLNLFKKQLAAKERKEKSLQEKRLKVKERKSTEPKTLSRIKFEAVEPDFKMGDELSGNLRNAEPTGNLLKDRYKSLQQRNILAPAVRVLKRNKAKVKRFQKADHKVVLEDAFKK